MYVTTVNFSLPSQKYQYTNVDFKAKKIPTKDIKPEKVMSAMTLMAGVLTTAGITAKPKEKVSESNKMSNEEFKARKEEIAKKVSQALKNSGYYRSEKVPQAIIDADYINSLIEQSDNDRIISDTEVLTEELTKNNILLISKILEDPKYKEDNGIFDNFGELIRFARGCKNNEKQNAKINFIDATKNYDELNSLFFIDYIESQQDVDDFLQFYNYVINNEDLNNYLKHNQDSSSGDRFDLECLYYKMGANRKLLPRIMEDENLKDHFKLLINNEYVSDKNYKQILDTLSMNKELLQNENVISQLKICNHYGPFYSNYRSIMRALFDTKELYKNKDIWENLRKIIENKPKSQNLRAYRVAIIKKIDSSEKLMQNQELMNNIGKILASMENTNQYRKIMDALEKIDNA